MKILLQTFRSGECGQLSRDVVSLGRVLTGRYEVTRSEANECCGADMAAMVGDIC